MRRTRALQAGLAALAMSAAIAAASCGDSADYDSGNLWPEPPNTTPPQTTPTVPEQEREGIFGAPAVLGDQVFVANETLNSVAVIQGERLSIRTVPVGFRPTQVAGPTIAQPSEDARLFVLNLGSATVTRIHPQTLATTTSPVLRHANRLISAPDGLSAAAWYDPSHSVSTGTGDLSAVSLIRASGEVYQLAVGFGVREVRFSEDGALLLVVSQDGVSVIDVDATRADALAPPRAVLPQASLSGGRDAEVLLDPLGRWAIARALSSASVTLTDLATGAQDVILLPEAPTDIDLAAGDAPRLLVMLRGRREALIATVPDGVRAAALATAPMMILSDDMAQDMPQADMSDEDMRDADMGADLSDMADEDMGASDLPDDMPPSAWPIVAQGVEVVSTGDAPLGAATLSRDGSRALLYTTINSERRAALLELEGGALRALRFEKGIIGVEADERGQTFVVFHDRISTGAAPTSPLDPGFLDASWGLSVVDVASTTASLVLTEQRPEQAALWSPEVGDAQLFVIFAPPGQGQATLASHLDVLQINLVTFRQDSARVPSLPERVGFVPGARRAFISQRHPQGRMTFVDLGDGSRQTITGYQLNAGID